jgi:protease I
MAASISSRLFCFYRAPAGNYQGMAHPRPLHGLRVAILVEDGFEESELTRPRDALHAAGATAEIVSPHTPAVHGWRGDDREGSFKVDVGIADAKPIDFDALVLPGGVRSADALRVDNKAVLFVHAMQIARKPVAALGHGLWILIETDFVRGRKLTSWPSLRTDLINAGGSWVNQTVVTDNLLVTGRRPSDIPAFNDAMVELFTTPDQSVAAAS